MTHSSPLLRAHRRMLAPLALALLVVGFSLLSGGIASAATAPVGQCNGILNTGGQSARCSVTVVNTLDAATGVGSSSVTLQVCTGAAGAPTCGPAVTSTFQDVVDSVSQCNASASGGGGELVCAVDITNNITGGATPTAATVNECVGSADGSGTMTCSPVSSTSGATVTQCNGSGNGGGSTVTCSVAPSSTHSASLPMTVNQCNGSANGGGSLVTCRTSITNNVLPLASPTPTTSPTSSPTTSPTAKPTAPSPSPVQSRPAGLPSATSPATPVALTTGGSLPRTGSPAARLSLLGALTTIAGVAILRLGARRYRGRHSLR